MPVIWTVSNPAVSVESAPGNGRALSLSHAAYPFVRDWDPNGAAPAKALIRIAGKYIEAVRQKFDLPPGLAIDPNTGKFANQPSGLQLTWLPIQNAPVVPVHAKRDPRTSFWFRRFVQGVPRDLGLVLLAVPTLAADDATTTIGSGLGLRVTARVLPRQNADWQVGITGSSCSLGLVEALDPQGPGISPDLAHFLRGDFKPVAKESLRSAAQLDPAAQVFIQGFRILGVTGDEATVEIRAHAPRPQGRPDLVTHALTARAQVTAAGQLTIQSFKSAALVAHQHANLFEQDPASGSDPAFPVGEHPISSRRPSRSPQELSPFTVQRPLPGIPAGAPPYLLQDDQIPPQVEVRESELLDGDPNVVRTVNVPLRDPRSDDFSAVSAYVHARDLFDRMRSYGLVPHDYFRFARFPLIVRYRATITTGDDGRTVNAAVDYDPPRIDFGQGWVGGQDVREPLQVRYALGDLKRSAGPAPRRHRLQPPPDREPLGIVADPRWSWHEFGHVLLAAATGALELPFAHSAGDAFAAIACDPNSRLAAAHQGGAYRGLTFPWIHAGRRHDRNVYLGWSWCGTYHRPLRFPDYVDNAQRKGYQSEQILSSSLFRLYRALGGDTVDATGAPDGAARLRAADYVIYLMMRAIQNLPAAVNGSAETPEQFVQFLMEADTGTWPAAGGPLDRRVGGWSHKVVRWAFEAQGLYGPGGDDVVNNAPGEPPAVDVFIDNGRPDSEGSYPRGGYMPVSLVWSTPAAGQEPWLATAHAMRIQNGRLRVRVRNRNGAQVPQVRVRAWYARWQQGQPTPPDWDPSAWAGGSAVWTELGNSPDGPHNIPVNGERQFGPFNHLPGQPAGRYVVLAAAFCEPDQVNINAGVPLPLPTATNATPLLDLVIGDNNLGLMIYTV